MGLTEFTKEEIDLMKLCGCSVCNAFVRYHPVKIKRAPKLSISPTTLDTMQKIYEAVTIKRKKLNGKTIEIRDRYLYAKRFLKILERFVNENAT